MSDQHCEAVRSWLRQRDLPILPVPPPSELVAHIVGCPVCRGWLATVAAELLHVPAVHDELKCADCEAALDSFIDCERRHGIAMAAQHYPDVWWHLWVCPDCAEMYDMTNGLVDAEQQVALPLAAPPVSPAWHARLFKIQLPRGFLHGVFAPQAALGAAWSGGEEESLFAEEQLEEYHIALHIRQRGGAYWGIGIVVMPPLDGWAVIRFGEVSFRAPFDQHGQALIADVPLGLLADRAGPDLLMTIEPAARI